MKCRLLEILLAFESFHCGLARLRIPAPAPAPALGPAPVPAPAGVTEFQQGCDICAKTCPINCKVGKCGLEYGFSVFTFDIHSPLCFTCAAAPVTPHEVDPAFQLCPNPGSPVAPSSVFPKPDAAMARLGDNAPAGTHTDSLAAAKADLATAVTKVDAANVASSAAVQQAMDIYQKMSTHLQQNTVAGTANAAEAAAAAAKAAANAALMKAQAKQEEWKEALGVYNAEAGKLRSMELKTHQLGKVLQRRLEWSEAARWKYLELHKLAMDAGKDAALGGGQDANILAAQEAALQAAAASQDAQREMVATASSSDAAATYLDYLAKAKGIALDPVTLPTVPPCGAALLQGKKGRKDCGDFASTNDAATISSSMSWMR